MHPGALHPYERSLARRDPLHLWHEDGRTVALDIDRWLAPADSADHTVLARAKSPVLDIGCGPGRMLAGMPQHGLLGLGIDIAETAIAMSRDRGVNCLRRSVFGHLPREGHWASALLLDGNIGIGGDPTRLLQRVRALIDREGVVIVETNPDADADERCRAHFSDGHGPEGPSFPWAYVGSDALQRHAESAALAPRETWAVKGRTFVALTASPRESEIGVRP